MATSNAKAQKLQVSREELQSALKILATTLDSGTKWASLSFHHGQLTITAGVSNHTLNASGEWSETLFIDARWVRAMETRLPEGDPVNLNAENGLFRTNSFALAYLLSLPEQSDTSKAISKDERQKRIKEAAGVLNPFLVTTKEVEAMVEFAQGRGASTWQKEEKAMIAAVAKAWIALAPLGVEPNDFRPVIDEAIRTAFTRKREP